MKTVLLFLGLVVASPIHFLFLEEAFDSDDSSADDFMKMMLLSPGLLGKSETQARQMNPMLPYMLMDKGNDENSKMIMMLMLEDPNISLDNILPYIMFENEEIDMKSLFLVTTVMQKNCESTNDQLNMLLPLLLFRNEEQNRRKRETEESILNEKIKMLILMQAMSDGNNGLDINLIMPYLMMNYETEANDEDNLLLMVLMNLISGEMDSKDGFRDNFNLLVPLLLGPEDREFDSDMLFILMAMQSQSPDSGVSSNTLLPLLLMDTESSNKQLIFFMSMINNRKCHQSIARQPVVVVHLLTPVIKSVDVQKSRWTSKDPLVLEPMQLPIQPIKSVVNKPHAIYSSETINSETEQVYRTWRVNLDGSRTRSRTLIDSNETQIDNFVAGNYEGSGYQ